jgi:flagellar motility protein MotE (MotC chaperone)
MSRFPRLLPLIGVAAGGVLAANALAGARALPELLGSSAAHAEEAKPAAAAPPAKPAAAKPAAKPAAAKNVCAPTAADLARQAGLSPSELRILQSLGERRGELDQREKDLSTQLTLMAAAEAKLDARIKALNAVKADIQSLIGQADEQKASEVDRLVRVYEKMKPKDAAPILTTLDDRVRLPVAARMKEQSLAAVMSQMEAKDAKALTEKLADRFTAEALAARAKAAAANAGGPPARKT